MTRSLELIDEKVRNAKHSFRSAGDRPAKAHKHRYERRKVREFLRIGDWGAEAEA